MRLKFPTTFALLTLPEITVRAAKAARRSTTKTSADIVFIYHALNVTPLQTVLIHFRSALLHRLAQLVTGGKGVKAIGYKFIIHAELKKRKEEEKVAFGLRSWGLTTRQGLFIFSPVICTIFL